MENHTGLKYKLTPSLRLGFASFAGGLNPPLHPAAEGSTPCSSHPPLPQGFPCLPQEVAQIGSKLHQVRRGGEEGSETAGERRAKCYCKPHRIKKRHQCTGCWQHLCSPPGTTAHSPAELTQTRKLQCYGRSGCEHGNLTVNFNLLAKGSNLPHCYSS